MKRIASGLAGALLVALWAAGVEVPPPDGLDTEMRQISATVELENGLEAWAIIQLSPPAIPLAPATSTAVRYISVHVLYGRNKIRPLVFYTLKPRSVDGDEAIAWGHTGYDPAGLAFWAGAELGVETGQALGMGADEDTLFNVDVRPADGLTWGEVMAEEHVRFTVTAEPDAD